MSGGKYITEIYATTTATPRTTSIKNWIYRVGAKRGPFNLEPPTGPPYGPILDPHLDPHLDRYLDPVFVSFKKYGTKHDEAESISEQNEKKLRWFPQNIQARMVKIKLP